MASGAKVKNKTISTKVIAVVLGVLTLAFIGLAAFQFNSIISLASNDYRTEADQLFGETGRLFSMVFQENLARLKALGDSSDIQAILADPADSLAYAKATEQIKSLKDSVPYAETVALLWAYESRKPFKANGKTLMTQPALALANADSKMVGTVSPQSDYYVQIAAGKDTWISPPRLSHASGKPIVNVARAISSNGVLKGIVMLAVRLDYFTDQFVTPLRIGSGYMFIIHQSGLYLAHPNKGVILKADDLEVKQNADLVIAKGKQEYELKSAQDGIRRLYLAQKWTMGEMAPWYLVFCRPVSEIYASATRSLVIMAISLIILLAVLWLVIAGTIRLLVAKPIKQLQIDMKALAEGNLVFGERQLGKKKTVAREDEVGILGDSLSTMRQQLLKIVSDITQAAEQVAGGSNALSRSSQNLSQGANEQAASIEELSSSMEEFSSMTKEAGDSLVKANQLAQRVSASA